MIARAWPHHEWDGDACCIHCGIDGCDAPRGSEMPPCTVHDEGKRAENRKQFEASREPDDWSDWDTLEVEHDLDMEGDHA